MPAGERWSAGYGIGAHLHPADEFLALDPASQIAMLFGPVSEEQAAAFAFPTGYVPLVAGDVLDLAGASIDVMHTPGHTPGHCCFHLAGEGVLFSGDQLFAGSIGRTDLPGGDLDALVARWPACSLSTTPPGCCPATGRRRRSGASG